MRTYLMKGWIGLGVDIDGISIRKYPLHIVVEKKTNLMKGWIAVGVGSD